jgi:hypothetical protein
MTISIMTHGTMTLRKMTFDKMLLSIITFIMMTLSIMTFSTMTLRKMAFGKMLLSIMTFSIMTLSKVNKWHKQT